jgi:hypothetical protein
VAEYVAQFSELLDQLIAYGHSTDPLYYTTRFVDGLRDDIHSTVLVQRTSSFVLLALLRCCRKKSMIPTAAELQGGPNLVFLQDRHPEHHFPCLLHHALTSPQQATLLLQSHPRSRTLPNFRVTSLLLFEPTEELEAFVIDVLKNGSLATSALPLSNSMLCRKSLNCSLLMTGKRLSI